MNDSKLIGVCLWKCILEIVEGVVKKEDVQEIISACTTEAFLSHAIPNYPKGYWAREPKKTVKLAIELHGKGLIKFPRDENENHFPITPELIFWVRSPAEIVWFDNLN
jgi:hypothetical protein